MTGTHSPLLSRPKAMASALVAFVDRIARAAGALGPGAFAWPVAIGTGLGVGVFALREPRFVHGVLKHRATMEFMRPALLAVAAATAGTLALALAVALVRRRRAGGKLGEEYVLALRRGAFLAALPFIVVLREPLEPAREWLLLGFVALSATLVTCSAYFWVREPRAESRLLRKWTTLKPTRARFVAGGVVCVAMAFYATLMIRLSLANHFSFNTGRSDLGYYVSLLRESSEGRLLQCTLCGPGRRDFPHFEPVLLLLAPLYRLLPMAETLLVLQTLWLGSGAVAVFLLGEHLVRSRSAAAALAVAYLAHPAVHGENLANFHALTLAVPLLLWLLYFLERGATRAYVIVLVLLLLVREDVTLALAGVGLFALFSGSREQARLGVVTLSASLLWALAVAALGGPGPFATLRALTIAAESAPARAHIRLMNPGMLAQGPMLGLARALSIEKMDYVAKLLVPLLGVPLLARGRIMLAYGAALALLAVTPDVASVHFEHSSLLVPFVFALAAGGLGRLSAAPRAVGSVSGPRLARALALGIAAGTLLCSAKLGALAENGSFRAGSRPLVRSVKADQLAPNAWLRKVSRSLPKGAKVAATSRLLPHLGSVSHLYSIADRSRADYVVANMKQRALAKELSGEETRGYLARADGSGDLRLYRTQYRGFVPPPAKRLDDE